MPRKNAGGKRPVGRPRVDLFMETTIKGLRRDGVGIQQIARRLRVGVSVVQRVDAELRPERERAQATATAAQEEAAASVAAWEKETRESGW